MKFKLKKLSSSYVGLVQALAVTLYVTLVSSFMNYMSRASFGQNDFLTAVMMLSLLVFSVALVGILLFGFPIYLIINKKVKQALRILGYTFLWLLLIIILVVFIVFVV
jgi:hypothetical protein